MRVGAENSLLTGSQGDTYQGRNEGTLNLRGQNSGSPTQPAPSSGRDPLLQDLGAHQGGNTQLESVSF